MASEKVTKRKSGKQNPKDKAADSLSPDGGGFPVTGWLERLIFRDELSAREKLLTGFSCYLCLNLACIGLYAAIVGIHPANAFLAALFGCLGLLVTTLALNQQSKSTSAAFFEYVLASFIVLLGAYTFLG